MAKKKKKNGGRKTNALLPFNKQGIKLGTLIAEAALVSRGHSVIKAYGWTGKAAERFAGGLIEFDKPETVMLWTGIGIAALGKFLGRPRFGPIQLS